MDKKGGQYFRPTKTTFNVVFYHRINAAFFIYLLFLVIKSDCKTYLIDK